MRAAPERDDVRVLDEDQRVGDLVALARRHQLALQRPDLAELAGAEVDEPGVALSPFTGSEYGSLRRARLGRLHDRLGQRRVGVDRQADVVGERAHLDGERGLGDDVRGAVADDVDAEHLLGLGVDDDLHEAVGVGVGDGAPERDERELADLDLAARASRPRRRVMPAVAISGSLKMTAGMQRTSISALWPAMTSATTSASCDALCASIGCPATSPMA